MTGTSYAAYRFAIVAFTALVAFVFAFLVARRPTRIASRLGMRGLKRQRALLNPFWATVEPFVRWAGLRVSGVLGEKRRNKLDLTLTHAGDVLGLTVDEYFAMLLSCGLAGALIGAIVAFIDGRFTFTIPVFALLLATVPHIMVDNARVARFAAINRGLPYAIDLMSLSMSAGLDFPGALHQVVTRAKANAALRDELGYILQQFQLGRTRTQVLAELAGRAPIDAVQEFVHALTQAEERGTPVASALEIQAQNARIRRANAAESSASDMKGKMVLPTTMILGVSMMLIAIPTSMMIERVSNGMMTGEGSAK